MGLRKDEKYGVGARVGVTEHEFMLISICFIRIKEFMVSIMAS